MMPDWIRIPMEDLTPHPMNAEVYGPDAFDIKMMESIRKHGILEPLVVTRENVIVSGHRRWAAAMRLLPAGTGLPCRVEEFEDELAEQEALVAHNLQREKTFSQRMAEGQVLDRIEYERSKRRQGTRTDIPAKMPEGSEEFGGTREKVAAKIGMGARTYGKAKKVVEAAEAGDEKAREAVQKIDAGEMSVDRAYKEVVKPPAPSIQIFYTEMHGDSPRSREFFRYGEMPDIGEIALVQIRDLQQERGVTIDRVLYNHTIVSVETLELMVETACRREGRLPAPKPAPKPVLHVKEGTGVVIHPDVLAIGPNHQVHIAAWYQYDGMGKPEREYCFQPISEGLEFIYQRVRHIEEERPGATFPKFKIGPYEVSREVFEALRPWGRMEEEKEHTVTVYYTGDRVPLVKFFDGVPQAAARNALAWLHSPSPFESVVRRIHFADGAGSDMDISPEGLAWLATPAPELDSDDGPISTRGAGGCCPERGLGKDGRCTGCGTVLLSEVKARYLHLLRDEIEATLEFSCYPHDGVLIVDIGGGHVVVVVPRSGDLPTALDEHLMGEASE